MRDEEDDLDEARQPQEPRNFGWVRPLLSVAGLIAVLGGWFWAADHMIKLVADKDMANFVLRSRDGADQIASNIARNLQDDVRRLANLPDILAGDVTITAPLVLKDGKTRRDTAEIIASANERLRAIADELELDLVYVLDEKGRCIAASNFDSDQAVIGTDLHARAYFVAIENGGRGRQFAFGTGTNVPGVYFSAPIYSEGEFKGGVIIKRSMRGLFRVTTRNTAFLVDEYGVIVASNQEKALWHFLPESSAVRLGSDFLQDRYHQTALSEAPIHPDMSDSNVSLITLFDSPEPSLMTARPIGDSGLRLVYFTPLPDLLAMRERANVAFWLLFGPGSLILIVVAGVLAYGARANDLMALLRQENAGLREEVAGAIAKKREFEESDKAKSRFLATISHELRTPFTSILGTVDLLRGCDLPPAALDQVGYLERGARALLSLLNNLLDFSKIDAGQLQVERMPFDLALLLREIGDLQKVVASAKGISLTLGGTDDPEFHGGSTGIGDPGRLRQIIDNLLSNAIKFTALGGVTLHVATSGEGEGRRLRIRVTDSGPGVDPHESEKLFQPFYQADNTIARKIGGTGLGLAISRRVAEAMGGQVGCESLSGQGATFWLDMPFPETELEPVNQAPLDPAILFAPLEDPNDIKQVLLVDDDEVNRLVLGGMLKRVGHQVVYANSGREAVREFAKRNFDLVVMDVHMPDLDGMEATRAIRTLPDDRAKTPILGLTADGNPENQQRYRESGLTELLTKPVGARELLAAVRRL